MTNTNNRTVQNPPMFQEFYYEGSRYLYDDFFAGILYFDGEQVASQMPLRLDLHTNEIQFLHNDSVYSFVQPVDLIVLNNEVFIYLDTAEGLTTPGFAKRWDNELPTLLTKMNINFYASRPFYISRTPNRFVRSDEYYVMINNDEIVKITTIKKLIAALKNNPEELTEYSKKENISADDPAKLLMLLNYYRKLQKTP